MHYWHSDYLFVYLVSVLIYSWKIRCDGVLYFNDATRQIIYIYTKFIMITVLRLIPRARYIPFHSFPINLLTHWGQGKMAATSQTTLSNAFSWMKTWMITAWRRPGDKPLSEPMMIRLPTHIYVTRPQWVKLKVCVYHILISQCNIC